MDKKGACTMIFEKDDRIIFAGDSVTDMESVAPVGECSLFEGLGKGFVRIVDSLLGAVYPELNLRISNSGISGNTSRDLLERYKRDVVDLKPDWVNILIGINDVWRQFDCPYFQADWVLPNEYEKNVEHMILSVKDTVKGIFIMSPYYMEPLKDDPMRKRMEEYSQICRELSEKYNCRFIDIQKMFDDYFKIRHSSSIAWDRIHPNQVGAVLIAREFLKCCDYNFYKQNEKVI